MMADLMMTVESVIIIVDDVKKLISIIMIIMLIIQYFPVRETCFFFKKTQQICPVYKQNT